jgi:hypothetical protein
MQISTAGSLRPPHQKVEASLLYPLVNSGDYTVNVLTSVPHANPTSDEAGFQNEATSPSASSLWVRPSLPAVQVKGKALSAPTLLNSRPATSVPRRLRSLQAGARHAME